MTKTGSYISKKIGRAIADYDLIEDGDKILVAVSGGKDSVALLRLLCERRRWAPVKYDLVAMYVESDFKCGSCINRTRLKTLFEQLGVEYRFESIKVRDEKGKTNCFWCSWNRRKALFLAADRLNCNKVAFGHHMDDIIETLLLNFFYHGEFAGMNPRQSLFNGKLTIIRPLCYVEESEMVRFARESRFVPQVRGCPNSEISKRRLMKALVNKLKKGCPNLKKNIFGAAGRVKAEYLDIHPEDPAEKHRHCEEGGDIIYSDEAIIKNVIASSVAGR